MFFAVGIDFGTENCVIAVARKGGIDVLTNEASYRTTPSMVTYTDEQRFIGQAAQAQCKRHVVNTVTNVKRLIGRKFSDEDVQRELPLLAYKVVQLENDEIGIELQVYGKRQVLTPVQVCGALLGQLKRTAEDALQSDVRDVVINVPGWWNDRQRRALLDAAAIAGLNPLQLINDLTACALELGIRKDKLLDKDKAELLFFFDMGASQTQCAVMKYSKGKLEVLSYACDHHLGGRNFTGAIVQHFRAEWQQKYKIDIAKSPKAFMRVTEAAQNLKSTLSINAEGSVNLDCLMEDKDVQGKLSRDKFSELVQPLLEQVLEPVKRALAEANVSAADIVSVEVVGDSHRIPAVGEKLNGFFGKAPSKRTNATEVFAKGAAWQCARRSPVFKVAQYELKDLQNYPVNLKWQWKVGGEAANEPQLSAVFGPRSAVPLFKQVTFKKHITEPTTFVAGFSYADGTVLPSGTPKDIGQWTISGIPLDTPTSVAGEKPCLKVGCKLDDSGIVFVNRAEKEWNEEIEYEEEQEVPLTEEELAEAAKKEEEEKDKAASEGDSTDKEKEKEKEDKAKEKEKEPKQPKTKKVKVTKKKVVQRSQKLDVSASCSALPQDTVQRLLRQENESRARDVALLAFLEEKNRVLSYIFEARDNLSGKWEPYVLPDVKEQFLGVLENTERWHEEEEEGRTKQDYTDKLKLLKGFGDSLAKISQEAEDRDPACQDLEAAARQWLEFADTKEAKYDHIGEEERNSVRSKAQAALDWLAEMKAKQDSTPVTSLPVLLVSDINDRRQNLEHVCLAVRNKPRPKPKPVEEKKPEDKKPEETKPEESKEEKPAAEENTPPLQEQEQEKKDEGKPEPMDTSN